MTLLWRKGRASRLLARLIRGHIRRRYGCYISPTSRVGKCVYLPHPVGIVIGDNVVVGDLVTLYQHVTLGQGRVPGVCPRIEPGAIVYAGAVLIGDIVIGSESVIGANAVVRISVPPRAVAAGVPASVIGQKN